MIIDIVDLSRFKDCLSHYQVDIATVLIVLAHLLLFNGMQKAVLTQNFASTALSTLENANPGKGHMVNSIVNLRKLSLLSNGSFAMRDE